jgi:ABC-type glycerol-3-phosphate transport system substrate-binding protein
MDSSSDQTGLVKHETEPEKIAEQFTKDHPEIRWDYDALGTNHERVQQLLMELISKLSNGELGEIIAWGDDYCDVVEYAANLGRLSDDSSFRSLMERTAAYILDMAVHKELNPYFPRSFGPEPPTS